jgi:FKBP-type peptidyl-prolyl cis-trans isomerase SlyD
MQKGDFIRIRYTGRLESGEIFDLTDEEVAKKEGIHSPKVKYGPIPIIVGGGFVLPGLDKELLSMKVGDRKEVMISSKDAFGDRNPELVKIVPQKAFRDQKVDPSQGMVVDFGGMKGRIQSAAGGRVTVDFNNPLAGKNLKYDIEIVEKIEKPDQQVKAVYDFFGAFNAEVKIEGDEAVVNATLPAEMRQRLANIILENVKSIGKVTYKESYTKQEKKEDKKESE